MIQFSMSKSTFRSYSERNRSFNNKGPLGARRLRATLESRSLITLDSSGVNNMAPSEILRDSSPAHRPDMIPLIE